MHATGDRSAQGLRRREGDIEVQGLETGRHAFVALAAGLLHQPEPSVEVGGRDFVQKIGEQVSGPLGLFGKTRGDFNAADELQTRDARGFHGR